MDNPIVIVLVLLGGAVVAWKIFLGAVKGVSKAVSAGVTEGRGGPPALAAAPAPAVEVGELQDALLMATYQLGVAELKRDPSAWGYVPDEQALEPPSDEERAAQIIPAVKMGRAIKKMSPLSPIRLVFEQTIEDYARKNGQDADKLAALHKEHRQLEIIKIGARVRGGQEKEDDDDSRMEKDESPPIDN